MKNGNNVKDKPLTKKDFWQDCRACILEQCVPEASVMVCDLGREFCTFLKGLAP